MTRTQVQFPDPLYERLKKVAARRDWSLAEVLRRAAEAYLLTIADEEESEAQNWTLPVLKPSGGLIQDPADVHAEADGVLEKLTGARRG
ncbi:MAG: CopG family transcriptional regulator [Verrucomicrobiales bacterium]